MNHELTSTTFDDEPFPQHEMHAKPERFVSTTCPVCQSRSVSRDIGKKTGAVVGAVAGTAGGISGELSGAITGAEIGAAIGGGPRLLP